ncbi:MAG: hypothetical protein MK101_00570 [Phycisphaerales bacterium]|nr:hypothetical protein [Phycisphaerales bacterium]
MAIRTSAGTGVIISLIVFVLLTVLLAVLSILLWGRLREAQQSVDNADQNLSQYASSSERTSDWMDLIKNQSGRKSVVGWLHDENGQLKGLLGGSSSDSMDNIKERMEALGLTPENTALDLIARQSRQLGEATSARSQLEERVNVAEGAVSDLQKRLNEVEELNNKVAQKASDALEPFRDAETRHDARINEAISEFKKAEARTRDRYTDQIDSLETENDDYRRRNHTLQSRLADLDSTFTRNRVMTTDPSLLADGRVIEVVGSDRVYLDRGKRDHVMLGMTFEVYDDPTQIQPDEDGKFPPGKASIQVLKVGDSTSTAKITRTSPRQHVLANDVFASLAYSPDYKFLFLVHGAFDVNKDGISTTEEAEHLRDRIRRWGGAVVEGDAIPGNLDFLILGDQPKAPERPQGASLSQQEWQDYTRRRQVYETYQNLFDTAREARIPVLNQNRFEVLSGQHG